MKQSLAFFIIFMVLICPLNACAEIIGKTDEEVKLVADPIMDTVLRGMADDDYITYSRYFDTQLKNSITKEKFIEKRQKILAWIGSYLFREYLGFVNKTDKTWVFWKGSFDRTKDDVLINMIISNKDGRILVEGLYYQ
jgi:hypothetical protein